MSVYQVTIFWGQATTGSSETYWTPDVSAGGAAVAITQLLSLRAQLLAVQDYFQGVRVALTGTLRRSQLFLPGNTLFFDSGQIVTVPATGTQDGTTPTTTRDQVRAALQVVLKFNNSRKTTRYMAGIPDVISLTEPKTIDGNTAVNWWTAFQTFSEFLINNAWRIRGQVLPPDGPSFRVVDVVAQAAAPGLVGVQISAATAPSINKGDKVALQGFRPAKGTRAWTINGTWYVASVDITGLPAFVTVYLRGSAGIDPTLQRFTDKTILRPVTYNYYQIQYFQQQRVGIHKRGKPSLAPRGRRLTRGSLDP